MFHGEQYWEMPKHFYKWVSEPVTLYSFITHIELCFVTILQYSS